MTVEGEPTTLPAPGREVGRRRARRRRAGAGAAVLLLGGATGVLGARLLGMEAGPLAAAVAATPYALVPAVAAAVLAGLTSHRVLVVPAVVVTLVLAALQAPLLVPDGGDEGPRVLTVMTSNLQYGRGDVGTVVDAVRERGVDVLSVQELTPGAVEGLAAAGLDTLLPHRTLDARPGARGTGLWSRFPLREPAALGPGFVHAHRVARISVPHAPAAGEVALAAVHPVTPTSPGGRWGREQGQLRAVLGQLPGTVVAAGDLNATPDHLALRRLADDGFAEARDTAGAGLAHTWATDLPFGPRFSIDHVLVRGPLVARRVHLVRVPQSDHVSLVAELHLRT